MYIQCIASHVPTVDIIIALYIQYIATVQLNLNNLTEHVCGMGST